MRGQGYQNPCNLFYLDRCAQQREFSQVLRGGGYMGRRGPAKEPSSLTLIKGNPGKRPINKKEPKPKPTAPKCPSWLNSDAKKMWRNLAPELEKLGLFTIVDGEAFAAACQSYGVWVQTEKVLMEKGRVMKIGRYDKEGNEISTYEQQRPEVSIGNSALKNFKSFCVEFGLTPSARTGIEIPDNEDGETGFKSLLSM